MGNAWMTEEQKLRQAEWERTHGEIITKIAGVTFENEDGTSRQKYLKEAYANHGEGELELVPFDYNGEDAIRVLYDGTCIGNIPKNKVADVLAIMGSVTSARLDVEAFVPEDEDDETDTKKRRSKIYRADLTLIYKKDVPDEPPDIQQQSPQPVPAFQSASKRHAPSQAPKKKTGCLPIIGIVLLVLVIFGNTVKKQSAAPSPAPTVAVETKPKTERSVIIQKCVESAESIFPDSVSYEYDEGKDVFTIFVGDDTAKPTGLAAKSGQQNAVDAWAHLVETLNEITKSMQNLFASSGYGTSVVLCVSDPENHDIVYLMSNNGRTLYDATKD